MIAFLHMLLLIAKIVEVYFFVLLFLLMLVAFLDLTAEGRAARKEARRKARIAKVRENGKAWIRKVKEDTARKAEELDQQSARYTAFMGDPYVCGFNSEGRLILGEWAHTPTTPAAKKIFDEMDAVVAAERKRISTDDKNIDFFANTKDL